MDAKAAGALIICNFRVPIKLILMIFGNQFNKLSEHSD
jgi:hypothetical protein